MERGKKEGITLVLSGGTAKGFAHIGILEVLEENKIPIKRILAVSAGALIGGIYAAGKLNDLKKEVINIKSQINVWHLLSLKPTRNSIFDVSGIEKAIKNIIGEIKIENLDKEFISLAYNLSKDEQYLFKKGKLYDSIRASISVPGLFPLFNYEGDVFIDGAFTNSLPADIAKRLFPNDKIVAVNLETGEKIKKNNYNLLNMLNFSINLQLKEMAKRNEPFADVVITPEIKEIKWDFLKSKQIINEGRIAAEKALPKIKRLLQSS